MMTDFVSKSLQNLKTGGNRVPVWEMSYVPILHGSSYIWTLLVVFKHCHAPVQDSYNVGSIPWQAFQQTL